MELKATHFIGITIGVILLITSLFIIGKPSFFFIIGLGILIGASPFVYSIIEEGRIAGEKEDMFMEFARNLVESVKMGTPISKSIINVRDKPYGVLSVNIRKLANQIYMGIPLNQALKIFSRDVNNKAISRTLTLIGQAERAGGDIGEILESVAESVTMTDKLKKERKAAVSSLVAQGYIIFIIFIAIVLIMQFKVLPMVEGISGISGDISAVGISAGQAVTGTELSAAFLYLLLAQGFFSGLAIGKLAEGSVKLGVKHSFALMLISFLISSISNMLFT